MLPFLAQTVPAGRDWFDTVVGVAGALNTLVLFALVVVLVPAVWSFTQSLKQLRALLDRIYDDLKPLTHHANRIAANVDEITETVRGEVKNVTDTIAQANQGLNKAVSSTEERIRKFGALVDVAQSEAERVFVSGAAAVRGAKAGARAVTGRETDEVGDNGDDTPRPRVRSRGKRPA